jgi:DNA-binding transcriptional ArsR family regulator
MGASKTENFSARHNKKAVLIKAVSHPARIAIIEYLVKVDSCFCGELVNQLPLSQPTVSQHLKELREVDLVKFSVKGNTTVYSLNVQGLEKLLRYFAGLYEKVSWRNS